MTKLLLNTSGAPLYNKDGGPVPTGGIVTPDEVDVLDGWTEITVKDLGGELGDHLSGNARAAVGDDASVKTKTASKGGNS